MKKYFLTHLLAFIPALTLTFAPAHVLAAGTARFELSPSNGTYIVDSTLSTAVSFTTNNEPVNVVTVKLDYDHAKLQLLSVDPAGSVFDQGFVSGDSITRYSMNGPVTGGKIATLNFKVTANSGTAMIGFAAGSQIARSNQGSKSTDIWDNTNTLGGTYALTAPAEVKSATTTTTAATTKKTATTSSSKGGETPAAPVTVPTTTTEDQSKAGQPTDDTINNENKGTEKKQEGKKTSNTWLRLILLGVAAAGFGYAAARRYLDATKPAAPAAEKTAAPKDAKKAAVTASKPAAKKSAAKAAPKKKTAPKKSKKTGKKGKK